MIKAIRLLVLICLIVLAGVGIGMSGGIPIPTSNKRQETLEVNDELMEPKTEASNLKLTNTE